MKKRILFFTENPPLDKKAIHIWLGKATLSHEEHLCRMLEKYLGFYPKNLCKNSFGKPYLLETSLHFNFSDSSDLLAMVFSWENPVGIDLEEIRPLDEMELLIEDCFSDKEKTYVYEEKEKLVFRFWQIWNRKEACLKALGIGLQDNMKSWDCAGDDWVFVNKVWVHSVPVKAPLSLAVAIV